MEGFLSFFDSQSASRNRWSYESLKNFRQISPVVQTHLKQVYLTLCCALVAFAVGAYLHILWNIGGFLTILGCGGSILWLLSTHPYEEHKRVSLLMAAATFLGASLGPLIELAIDFDPSVLVGGSLALFKFELYFGLLLFVGCIVVDTQDIIEKAHYGDLDYVKHSLTLFTDFVAVFVRVIIIMLKNASGKEEKKKEDLNVYKQL